MPRRSPISRRFTTATAVGLLLGACSLSPLNRRIEVGEEPYAVFVAEGRDGWTDLFATLPGGGDPVRLTFTALVESRPRLTSRGDVVAFVRERRSGGEADLVVMNLLNGAERVLEMPPEAGPIEALGWSDDDRAIYLRTAAGHWRISAPPAPATVALLGAADLPAADSALAILLGTPAFARATLCDSGGVCVVGPSGTATPLSEQGSGPFRWGRDSVAWFEDGAIVVRALGPGIPRRIEWTAELSNAREGSYAEPE